MLKFQQCMGGISAPANRDVHGHVIISKSLPSYDSSTRLSALVNLFRSSICQHGINTLRRDIKAVNDWLWTMPSDTIQTRHLPFLQWRNDAVSNSDHRVPSFLHVQPQLTVNFYITPQVDGN
jgi:hypothetical protein